MSTTYRAIQAIAPGKLLAVELAVAEPPPGYVRIRIEACGICHSDAATVEGALQGIRAMVETFPLAKAQEAYRRMMNNEARFRIVRVTGQ